MKTRRLILALLGMNAALSGYAAVKWGGSTAAACFAVGLITAILYAACVAGGDEQDDGH